MMRPKWQFSALVLALVVLAARPMPALAKGMSAKAALAQSVAAGKKWHADAVLTGVSTTTLKGDGTADAWLYAFYSPKTKKFLIVTAQGTKLDTLEVGRGMTDPVGDDFIDSDKAMQEAKKNGVKGKSPTMALNFMGNVKTPGAFWTVGGGFESGDVSIILEAKTGKLFMKNQMP
jgi:hypothetical protein